MAGPVARAGGLRYYTALLICFDALIAMAGCFIAYKLRFHPHAPWELGLILTAEDGRPYAHIMMFAPFVRIISGYLTGLYRTQRKVYRMSDDLPVILAAVTLGSAILVLIAFFGVFQYRTLFEYREFTYSRFFFVYDWLLVLLMTSAVHTAAGLTRNELVRRGVASTRVAIQGRGASAQTLANEANRLRNAGYTVVGVIDKDPHAGPLRAGGAELAYLGSSVNILPVINVHQLDEIVVTDVRALDQDFLTFCDACHELQVVVRFVPDVYGMMFQGQPVDEMGGLPVIQVNDIAITGVPHLVKRVEDTLIALGTLAVMSPVMLLTAALIKLESPGPVLFAQYRLGKNGRAFRMYKFRSMRSDAENLRTKLEEMNQSDGPLFKIKDDPRVTRIGRLIRRTSIDELPQLFNVLRGEMSLIGPRPLPSCDIQAPDEWDRRRFAATPGITGLWQVNRVTHTSEEMLKWDLYYVENWSLWLDMRILLKTAVIVLTGKGAY